MRGAEVNLEGFEKALVGSGAVVNCSLYFLKDFLSQEKMLYSNYHQLVDGKIRKAAASQNEQERTVADALLFRSYAKSITFAALSLSDRGLTSYGDYALRLRTIALAERASVLEENSFKFVEKHNLNGRTPIPNGYRSDWNGRIKLAVAKLQSKLDVGRSQNGGFRRLLLHSEGDYATDEFMEVHIFGTFDFNAVEAISGPVPKRGMDQAIWEAVKEDASAAGKRVEEW